MVQFSALFEGLAKSVSFKGSSVKNDVEKETSETTASIFSKKGEKGLNQDCSTVWEKFGYQHDMAFCGVFDGHGPWGHFVAKWVCKHLPSLLLNNWQEMLALHSLGIDFDAKLSQQTLEARKYNIWKQSYYRTSSAIDETLEHHPRVDSFDSGSTALTIVRQGEYLVVANTGDSRAVLATIGEDGKLAPIQLTVDQKPNLPEEAERIKLSRGRVICSHDEPGVYRIWPPSKYIPGPGLALSRAFGDHALKKFGLISEPQVTQSRININDQFVILGTDGVWDVISNEEAVQIVNTAPSMQHSAKRLVKYAAQAWKTKRPGIAMDDISVICMYLHPRSSPSCQSELV